MIEFSGNKRENILNLFGKFTIFRSDPIDLVVTRYANKYA